LLLFSHAGSHLLLFLRDQVYYGTDVHVVVIYRFGGSCSHASIALVAGGSSSGGRLLFGRSASLGIQGFHKTRLVNGVGSSWLGRLSPLLFRLFFLHYGNVALGQCLSHGLSVDRFCGPSAWCTRRLGSGSLFRLILRVVHESIELGVLILAQLYGFFAVFCSHELFVNLA